MCLVFKRCSFVQGGYECLIVMIDSQIGEGERRDWDSEDCRASTSY